MARSVDHWAALAASGMTLAIYMGKTIAGPTARKLVGRGMSPALPVGIVVNAGRSDRSFHLGTLGVMAAGEVEMAGGPAIIFIGEAVKHGDWAEATAIAEQTFKVA